MPLATIHHTSLDKAKSSRTRQPKSPRQALTENTNTANFGQCKVCLTSEHGTNRCPALRDMPPTHREEWIKKNNACKKCAGSHPSENCRLPAGTCSHCYEGHLTIFHDLHQADRRDLNRWSAPHN